MAFKSGAITGLLVAGLALLAITFYYIVLINLKLIINRKCISSRIRASLISIFARLGGNFTKGADVGADLVGKVEAEFQKMIRNPAVIMTMLEQCR